MKRAWFKLHIWVQVPCKALGFQCNTTKKGHNLPRQFKAGRALTMPFLLELEIYPPKGCSGLSKSMGGT